MAKETITWQRVEGLALFSISTLIYFDSGFSWLIYVLLILVFDLFMLGYLVNNKIGAFAYNIGHSLVSPALVLVIYFVTDVNWLLALACLWISHIGIDRLFGYGLKTNEGFKHTHLGKLK